MKNWNKDDWQGKRQDQVNYSHKIGVIVWVLMLIILVGGAIHHILN